MIPDNQCVFFSGNNLKDVSASVPLCALTCVSGASGGGKIVAEGTPEQIAKVKKSCTGQFLTDMLARRPIKRPQAV